MSELRQIIGTALRGRKIPSWLLVTAKGCYSELGYLVTSVVRENDPLVIAAIARAETVAEVCRLAPPTRELPVIDGRMEEGSTTASFSTAGKTILLIEDDIDVRLTVRGILEEEGYRVVALRDGGEALAALEEVVPSMMLVDLMMPRLNGWAFIKQVKTDTRWAGISVCVISAFANLRAPEGIAALLQKPLDRDLLLSTVATHARGVQGKRV